MEFDAVQQAFDGLSQLSYAVRAALTVVSGIIGAVMLLFGYRVWKVYLFIVGSFVGWLIAWCFTDLMNALLIGLCAGLLSIVLWYVALFLISGILGMALVYLSGARQMEVQVTVGVLLGILALVFRRLIIILLTSFSGACSVIGMVDFFFPVDDQVYLLLSVGLAVIGIVLQYTVLAAKPVGVQDETASPGETTVDPQKPNE